MVWMMMTTTTTTTTTTMMMISMMRNKAFKWEGEQEGALAATPGRRVIRRDRDLRSSANNNSSSSSVPAAVATVVVAARGVARGGEQCVLAASAAVLHDRNERVAPGAEPEPRRARVRLQPRRAGRPPRRSAPARLLRCRESYYLYFLLGLIVGCLIWFLLFLLSALFLVAAHSFIPSIHPFIHLYLNPSLPQPLHSSLHHFEGRPRCGGNGVPLGRAAGAPALARLRHRGPRLPLDFRRLAAARGGGARRRGRDLRAAAGAPCDNGRGIGGGHHCGHGKWSYLCQEVDCDALRTIISCAFHPEWHGNPLLRSQYFSCPHSRSHSAFFKMNI
jgi:hypothetical protein